MSLKITAAAEDIRSADSQQLLKELTAELAALYPMTDGTAGFKDHEVEVPRAAFIVARVDGRAAGCGALRPIDDTTIEVKRMYTRKEYRQLGVAKAVLAEMDRLAIEFGYTTIKLSTGPLQPEAAALYHRVGYYRIPSPPKYERSLFFQKDLVRDAKDASAPADQPVEASS